MTRGLSNRGYDVLDTLVGKRMIENIPGLLNDYITNWKMDHF
jgi:hypothetical protein